MITGCCFHKTVWLNMSSFSTAEAEIEELKRQLQHEKVKNDEYQLQLKRSQDAICSMSEHYDDAGKFHGRNQVKAAEFDVMDRHNREVLSKWLRFVVMPYVKFFSTKMVKYSEDKDSMCQRIMAVEDVMFPPGAVKAMSYETKLIPIANRIVVDRKSVFTADLRREWASK